MHKLCHRIIILAGSMAAMVPASKAVSAAPIQIVVPPDMDLARVVGDSPPGTTFILQSGRHYSANIQPKDGQTFEGKPGAVLTGAVRLETFVNSESYWKAAGPPPLPPSHGSCDRKTSVTIDACRLREALFIDGTPLARALTRESLNKDSWYQDRATGDILLSFNPGKRLVELSYNSVAFSGNARDVTIRDLTIEQFASIAQHGAIEAKSASGWVIVGNEIRFNSGYGIRTGEFMRAQFNRLSANGQMGISGSGDNLFIASNEIFGNNTHAFNPGWEAGATKFVDTNNLLFVRNCVHDNMGAGIWTDIDNRNSTIVGNWAIGNSGPGIMHEISGRAIIANNVSAFNGTSGNSPWASQILVSGSVDTLVWHNQVEVGPNQGQGIFVVEENRANETKIIHDLPEYASRRNLVMDNEITYAGGAGVSGYYSSKGDVRALMSANRFEKNSSITSDDNRRRFRMGARYLTLPDAQNLGQELKSQLLERRSGDVKNATRPTCPPEFWDGRGNTQ